MVALTRSAISARLLAHRADLERMGVRSLALFGSVARGDAKSDSDVDLLADLAPVSLFAVIRIEHYLEDVLGREADLIPMDDIRPQLRPDIEAQAIRVL